MPLVCHHPPPPLPPPPSPPTPQPYSHSVSYKKIQVSNESVFAVPGLNNNNNWHL